jgi:hypothetical protein
MPLAGAACSQRRGTPCPRTGRRVASPAGAGQPAGGGGPRSLARPQLTRARRAEQAEDSAEEEIQERLEHGPAFFQTGTVGSHLV